MHARNTKLYGFALACLIPFSVLAADVRGASQFHREIEPILKEYCYDCHGDGMKKGEVSFDGYASDEALLKDRDVWWRAMKNLRTGIMPPRKKSQPDAKQKELIEKWIKSSVFRIDPKNPDPGRVTVRRLNRVEYRNTIRDLMGVDFDTQKEFPPDDTGNGFDNIGDVLTLSPMLLEKYLSAAQRIVSEVVPDAPRTMPEQYVPGRTFREGSDTKEGNLVYGALSLSYSSPANVSRTVQVANAGHYKLVVDMSANEQYIDDQFDYNKCRFKFSADGQELLNREFVREGGEPFHFTYDVEWKAGDHILAFQLEPLTPGEKQVRNLTIRIDGVNVKGPMDEKYWTESRNHGRFFPRAEAPKSDTERRAYAREMLGGFAEKAFRRPVDKQTVDRLVALAESVYTQPGKAFEAGVSHTMVAVLASPRFLFREEDIESGVAAGGFPLVDEFSLASRLSYFLWSSMPDAELFRLAGEHKLRTNLDEQVKRMLRDPRAAALTRNFAGQWLQARDIENVPINPYVVQMRDDGIPMGEPGTFRRKGLHLRNDLNPEVREAMHRETELYFERIVREDRSVVELIESDYTYLNEKLAHHYGLTNLDIKGTEMRLVKLPPDCPRGGVLTQGTVLAVTSNPTRTSPVKRGLFISITFSGLRRPRRRPMSLRWRTPREPMRAMC